MNKSSFQFRNPELENIVFSVNNGFNSETCNGIAIQYNTETRLISDYEAYVSLTLHVGSDDNTQPFNIIIKMVSDFIWEESIDNEKAKKMLKINAPAVLLSYIRPIVANITNSSKYNVLNIPFIDFTKDNEE